MVEMITESSAALPLHHQQYKQWKPSQYSDQWLQNTEIRYSLFECLLNDTTSKLSFLSPNST